MTIFTVRHPIRLLVAVVALAIALAASTVVANGDGKRRQGAGQIIGLALQGQPTDKDLRLMKRSGVDNARLTVYWSAVEAHPGTFDWARTDAVVGGLASKGIEPFPTLLYTPKWLANNPRELPVGNARQQDAWRTFLKAAVQRYGPGGRYWRGPYRRQFPQAKPKPIDAWQIWNEPNGHTFVTKPSPKQYGKLVRISSGPIKQADRNGKLVIGGLEGHGIMPAGRFLRALYHQRGAKRAIDIAASHPYASDMSDLRARVREVRAAMRSAHQGKKPLWITEIGWGSAPPSPASGHHNVGLLGQKKVLSKSFRVLLHNRRKWRIGAIQWFYWRDPATVNRSCTWCSTSGLLRNNYRPKPAFSAYTHFAER